MRSKLADHRFCLGEPPSRERPRRFRATSPRTCRDPSGSIDLDPSRICLVPRIMFMLCSHLPYASTALVRPGTDPSQFMATLFESAASMPARPSPASRPRKSDAIESKRLLNWPFDGIHIEPPKFSMPVRTSDGHFLARGLPRAGHYLCAFQSKHRSRSTSHSEPAMPIVKARVHDPRRVRASPDGAYRQGRDPNRRKGRYGGERFA